MYGYSNLSRISLAGLVADGTVKLVGLNNFKQPGHTIQYLSGQLTVVEDYI